MKRLLLILMLLPLALAWAADDEAVFPIGGYAGDIESYRNTAFSLLGPVYRHQERQLQLAEELNLPCVYRIGVAVDFHGKHGPPVKTLDREKIRAEMLTYLRSVDFVTILPEPSCAPTLGLLKPDVFITVKEDWAAAYKESKEYKTVTKYGGEVKVVDRQSTALSTTKIIQRAIGGELGSIFKDFMELRKDPLKER